VSVPPRAEDARQPTPRVAPGRVTALVLAGGASRRMGRDKIALELDGRPLLAHALAACAAVAGERIVVGREAPPAGVPADAASLWIADDPSTAGAGAAGASAAGAASEPRGPLAGLATGLARAGGEVALLVGGDMPALRPALLALLAGRAASGGRIVIPVHEGRPQPLCSAWPVALAAAVARLVAAGERSPLDAARALDAELLDPAAYAEADPRGDSFLDVDTPEALAAARRLLAPPRGGRAGTARER
jgi:molybdopterin-guanine dinucleotide biosynthesis protein A